MRNSTQKGFTLVEMVAVLGIFAVLSSIVIFNYTKFRSDTILTNMAYEVALSIREAQIYGVSARNGGPKDFSVPYGIYMPVGSNQYFLFADTSKDSKFSGTSCSIVDSGGDTCIVPYTLQQNIRISQIQVKMGDGSCLSESVGGSILFKRPNPEPIMKRSVGSDPSQMEITLSSADGTKRYVSIYNNGQIAVINQPVCN